MIVSEGPQRRRPRATNWSDDIDDMYESEVIRMLVPSAPPPCASSTKASEQPWILTRRNLQALRQLEPRHAQVEQETGKLLQREQEQSHVGP